MYIIVKAKVSLKVRVEANLRSGSDSRPKKPKIAKLDITKALFSCRVILLRIKNLLGLLKATKIMRAVFSIIDHLFLSKLEQNRIKL